MPVQLVYSHAIVLYFFPIQWIAPTAFPTGTPTDSPTVSFAPTGVTGQLTTPSPSGGYASAYGYMFDVKSKSSEALRVLKFSRFYTNSQCNFDLWSTIGESSFVSNHHPAAWTLMLRQAQVCCSDVVYLYDVCMCSIYPLHPYHVVIHSTSSTGTKYSQTRSSSFIS